LNGELPAEPAAALERLAEMIHAQKSQIDGLLAALDARSGNLDAAVGDAVQRALDAAGIQASERIARLHRATGVRFARWSFGVVSACAMVPAVLSWFLMPSQAQLLRARQTRDELTATVAQLAREGGRIELRHCGEANRLCVRVERKLPLYGEGADFMVLKGY
jgi:hypothetical protein